MYILLAKVTPRKISSATVTIKCSPQFFFSFLFPAWSHRYLFRVSSGTLIFQLEEQTFFPRTDRQQMEWNKFTDILEARENSPSLTPIHEDIAESGSQRPTFQFQMPTFQFHVHSSLDAFIPVSNAYIPVPDAHILVPSAQILFPDACIPVSTVYITVPDARLLSSRGSYSSSRIYIPVRNAHIPFTEPYISVPEVYILVPGSVSRTPPVCLLSSLESPSPLVCSVLVVSSLYRVHSRGVAVVTINSYARWLPVNLILDDRASARCSA